jgi:hypothetical protein
VKFVVKLVTILKVADLTQENVSCLNTSLVSFSEPLSRDFTFILVGWIRIQDDEIGPQK